MPDRFDKFTKRAQTVLMLAGEEASRLHHNYIGTEHLLLGLVREGGGIAAQVLTNMDVDLALVRSKVETIIGRGKHVTHSKHGTIGPISLTPRAKKVIGLAVDEARRLNHHYVGTEHLLLGLIREGEGIGAGVLEDLGISLQRVRREVMLALDKPLVRNRPARPTLVLFTTIAIVTLAAIILRQRISNLLH